MESVAYAHLSRLLHKRLLEQRVPLEATFEVSRRCPLVCQHCYNNLPMHDHAARRRELSLDEYRRIFDEIAEAGTLWVLFTGGEILARADFLEIYTEAKQRGFLITLFTNGTLITPRIADYLAEWQPFAIEITLYGHTRTTYERMTRVPGSYDRCHRGIQLLLERKLPLKLKTVGTTITKDEIFAMRDFAESLGVPFKFDSMLNPRIDCSQAPLEVRLTPEEVIELDLRDPRRLPAWQDLNNRYQTAAMAPYVTNTVYDCGGGVGSFAVNPYGEMSICVLSQMDTYDLRQGSFRDGWEHFLRQVRLQQRTRPAKCASCEIRPMCSGCAAVNELENGDKESAVDFHCRANHLRAYLLDIPLKPNPLCEYRPGSARYEDIQASVALLRARAAELGVTLPATSRRSLPVIQPSPAALVSAK
ncbi:MAG: radical SAM protein [Chloracidobacterium sp.]